MDGFNSLPWPPDNQNSTMPGAETADDEFGGPNEVDGQQQQSAPPSYYFPNEVQMGLMAEEYNQLETGDTAPSNFRLNRSQYLAARCGNLPPHLSNSFGFAHGNARMQAGSNKYTDDYASPMFASPASLHANQPLNTGSNQLAFDDQRGGSFYCDSRMTPNQSGNFNPPLNTSPIQPAFTNQGGSSCNHDSRMAPSRPAAFKYRTSKLFSDLPLELQIMVWKHSFPAGRAAFIDYAMCPNQIKLDERRTGLPITLAICMISRKVTMEHYTIVDRHGEDSRAVYTKPFCFNPEVDTLCITYDFIEEYNSERVRNDWYEKVDEALKKRGALKGVGLKGVRSLDVRDVVTSLPVVTSDISWFLPRVYKNSFLSRFESLDRLVFTSACATDDRLPLPRTVALESLGECELFWDNLAKYLENKRNSHKGKLVAKENIIVREYEAPQGLSALENLDKMCWLF